MMRARWPVGRVTIFGALFAEPVDYPTIRKGVDTASVAKLGINPLQREAAADANCIVEHDRRWSGLTANCISRFTIPSAKSILNVCEIFEQSDLRMCEE